MADKRCDNGHFIDETWDICPYCPVDKKPAEVPLVRSSPPSRSDSSDDAILIVPGVVARSQSAPEPRKGRSDPGGGTSSGAPDRTIAVVKPDPAANGVQRYVVGWMVGLNSSIRGESFPLRMGRNVIGRDRRSDIYINDDQASSHHADLVFRPEEKRFILMDHNSTNGTFVNESEIEPRRDLVPSDIVRIGSHRFLFVPLCRQGLYWDDEGQLK